jgi:hypothetical protein
VVSIAVAALFSGAGTLTAAGVPRPSRAVGLSGSGVLSVTAALNLLAVILLSGEGQLGAERTPALVGVLALSGEGTLVAQGGDTTDPPPRLYPAQSYLVGSVAVGSFLTGGYDAPAWIGSTDRGWPPIGAGQIGSLLT